MATDTAALVEQLGKMTVLELVELKNALEEEWGVTAAAPMAVAAAAPAGVVTTQAYAALYHEIFNEPERAEVYAALAQWLERRIGGPAAGAGSRAA